MVEPRAAVQDTSPIRGEGTRQASHPTAKDKAVKNKGTRFVTKHRKLFKRNYNLSPYFNFKHGSALSKEEDQNQFACRLYKGVQRELGPADSGSLGTTDSSRFPTTPCKSTSSNISSPQLQLSLAQQELVSIEIQAMLGKQAIRVVQPDQRGFVSQIFLVPKKDGGHRPVINLKALNKFIVKEHFKMEGFRMVKDIIKPGDWLAKIDLKDAYFLVPVHYSHQKFNCSTDCTSFSVCLSAYPVPLAPPQN